MSGCIGVLGVQMGCFVVFVGERGVWGCKWGALRCLRVKWVFGGVKGCRRHNGVVWGANEVLAMGVKGVFGG